MKKIIYLALLLASLAARGQNAISYKIKYLPGHKYNTETGSTLDLEMDLLGDKKELDKFPLPPGMQLPLVITTEKHSIYVLKTGESKNKMLPIVIDFKQAYLLAKMNDQTEEQKSPLHNVKIFASMGKEKTVNSRIAYSAVMDILECIQSDLKFSKKEVKVGDSFNRWTFLDVPIPEIQLPRIDVKITYKLIEIKDNNAYFDLIENVDFVSSSPTANLDLQGKGVGKLVYDINNAFVSSLSSSIAFAFTIKRPGIMLKGKAKLSTTTETVTN
jgi:hypothetical protein